MARLLNVLEQSSGAHAICNEYDITVYRSVGEHADGTLWDGWLVRVRDYLANDGTPGSRRVVVDCRFEFWDEVNGALSELGMPDDYEGWS